MNKKTMLLHAFSPMKISNLRVDNMLVIITQILQDPSYIIPMHDAKHESGGICACPTQVQRYILLNQ